MSFWKTPAGVIGDGPADIIGEAIDEVRACYRAELEREPTAHEIHAAVDFVLAPLELLSGPTLEQLHAQLESLEATIEALRKQNAELEDQLGEILFTAPSIVQAFQFDDGDDGALH